jgi:excinuclease ABC subunit A
MLVVEHDAETIAAGPAADVLADPASPTGRALLQTARIERPQRALPDAFLELTGARAHNLKGATFRVPAGRTR